MQEYIRLTACSLTQRHRDVRVLLGAEAALTESHTLGDSKTYCSHGSQQQNPVSDLDVQTLTLTTLNLLDSPLCTKLVVYQDIRRHGTARSICTSVQLLGRICLGLCKLRSLRVAYFYVRRYSPEPKESMYVCRSDPQNVRTLRTFNLLGWERLHGHPKNSGSALSLLSKRFLSKTEGRLVCCSVGRCK